WAGEGTVAFAANRRNNPESQVAELLARGGQLRGPTDHSVPVLAVRAAENRLCAVVFGYACHCTTLSFYKWSGDYAGFAQIALEQNHPDAMAMFYAGCGADQNPLPRRSVEMCRKYGEALAAGVEDVLGKPMRPIAPRLQTAFAFVELDYEKTLSQPDLEAAAEKDIYQQRR
ncbi:MAG: hypothetical protein GTO62_19850, partial [Planctomycetales bacterium]|nr:hypothetical protein [Planctomycetales bacterium]